MTAFSAFGRLRLVAAHLRDYGAAATAVRVAKRLAGRRAVGLADYALWRALYDRLGERDCQAIGAHMATFSRTPLMSLVLPVDAARLPYLARAVDAVVAQLYPHWELLVLAADGIAQQALADACPVKDGRIRLVAGDAQTLPETDGDFVVVMEADAEIPPHALYALVAEIDRHPTLDIVYSDEDEIDRRGRRRNPYFKPDWNPELFGQWNYLGQLCAIRRSRISATVRLADLPRRLVESHPDVEIRHVPMVLCHRRGAPRAVDLPPDLAPPPNWPTISVIIPTRDGLALLRQCIDGLREETDYPSLDIIVVDNDSADPATLAYLHDIGRCGVRVLAFEGPFNYSAINNFAVRQSSAEVILFLNNDIKIIHRGWLKELVAQACRPGIGAVGAKLYYPDDTIQHAGVVLGLGGVAGHLHAGAPRQSSGYHFDLQTRRDVSAVTAACLALRRSVFDEVGGFDAEQLPVAFNDVDLCLRIRDKGHRILWSPRAELYHLESASRGSDMAPDKIARFKRDQRVMHERWGAALTTDPFHNPNLALDSPRCDLAYPPRAKKPWTQGE